MTSIQMNSYLHSEISRKFLAKLSVLKSICGPMNKKNEEATSCTSYTWGGSREDRRDFHH